MNSNDKFVKLVKTMQDYFTYMPTVPNIIVVLHGYSTYTIHKANLINTIYPVMKELNPNFDEYKYAEDAKNAYFNKLDLVFNMEEDYENTTDAIGDYYNTVNGRLNYVRDQFDANEEELSKDLSFMFDLMELTYTASRYLHTYIYSVFEYQVYIDKELDANKHHDELDDFVSCGLHIINYMFKRTYMYEKGEILYGRELADEYIEDMYDKSSDKEKVIFKEALSFCFEKSYIPEEFHNDILDIFQKVDNSKEEIIYN